MTEKNRNICYLCGESIEEKELSDDHVPPKSFYPKDIRPGLNLQLLPTHKHCNNSYKKDEEYFQHAFLIEVLNHKPSIVKDVVSDFRRRSRNPQTPALIRTILKRTSNITSGGIYLPNRMLQVEIDQYRIERVTLKIVRGLFYLEYGRFLPLENAKDIRFCSNEADVPELYKLYWQHVELKGVCPDVFSFKRFEFDSLHLYSLMFWNAFMSCVAFEDPG